MRPNRKPAASSPEAEGDQGEAGLAGRRPPSSGPVRERVRRPPAVLELDRTLLPGGVGQVQMLVLLGEFPEAELWAKKSLELFSRHGDLMAGRRRLSAGSATGPRHWNLPTRPCGRKGARRTAGWFGASSWYRRRDEVDRHCFDKAVQADRDWLVPLETALIYLHHEQPSKALLLARDAVEKAPDSFYAWLMQGRCEQALGFDRPGEAELRALPGAVTTPRRGEPQARRGREPGLVVDEGTAAVDRPLTRDPTRTRSDCPEDMTDVVDSRQDPQWGSEGGASDVHLIRGISPAVPRQRRDPAGRRRRARRRDAPRP